MSLYLNVGCGDDYRDGYLNIDGSSSLHTVDKVIDLGSESLLEHFARGSVDFILANDIVEHLYHWQAVRLLDEFNALLKPSGRCEIRVPDAGYIISSWRIPLEQKLLLLFGGQDIPQGDNVVMNESRRAFPEFFCHKYGWTRKSLAQELTAVGFGSVRTSRAGTNFIAYATKS